MYFDNGVRKVNSEATKEINVRLNRVFFELKLSASFFLITMIFEFYEMKFLENIKTIMFFIQIR